MTQPWQPKYIPLVDGIDEATTGLLADKPGINQAENVDFSRKGEVRGRPGFQRQDAFGLRTYDTSFGSGASDAGTAQLSNLPVILDPVALHRYRDQAGERPALTTFGRTFTYEGDRWTDRLYGGAARVDRLVNLLPLDCVDAGAVVGPIPSFGTSPMPGVADTYMVNGPLAICPMLGTNGAVETMVPTSASGPEYGVGCTVVTGGHSYHVFVSNNGTDTNVHMRVRVDDDQALIFYILESDCKVSAGLGAFPVCCTDASGSLYVAYPGNGAFVVALKVDPTDGTVLVKQTIIQHTDLSGIWLASRTADSSLLLVYTRQGQIGAVMQPLEPTLVAAPPASTIFDPTAIRANVGPVVVGPSVELGNHYWVAYLRGFDPAAQETTATNVQARDLVIGRALVNGNGTVTAPVIKEYLGTADIGVGPNLAWGIVHQPVTVSGRTVLTVAAGAAVLQHLDASDTVSAELRGATWYALDITDLRANGTGPFAGGTEHPGMLAMGPNTGSDSRTLTVPVGAVVNGDSWRFATCDYRTFDSRGGQDPVLGINQVTLLAPRAAVAGRGTVFSGSVPHQLAGGYMAELGFPFLGAPEISVAFAGGGSGFAITAGSYTIQACWTWFDESGQRHRSGPSLPQTLTANGSTDHVMVIRGLACQLTERETAPTLEVYCTLVNPPANAPKYLVATVDSTVGQPVIGTVVDFSLLGEPTGTEPILYTTGGVFANRPVSGDGGVAALGRRLWMSDGEVVYASKLLKDPTLGPAFNDEGPLQARPPATAGRVIALESMDDKLVILCERGIYITEGDGPDDNGNGQDFLYPVKASDLGLASSRSSIGTSKGVLFHARNTATDGATGGLWLLTGSGQAVAAGVKVQDEVGATPLDLTYVPERERAAGAAGGKLVVWDMRADQWATWTGPSDAVVTVGEAAGVLWACGAYPACYTLVPGQDDVGGMADVTMTVTTNHMYANGQGGLGWARVRAVSALGELATNYLTMSVLYDMAEPWVSKGFNLVATPGTTITWPSDRYAPEWRLPRQKCSQLQVQLSATPATGAWSVIRLDIAPRKTAPAKFRQ